MRISPRGPVAVASCAWRGLHEPMVTLVARVTYELEPVRSVVAPRAEPVRLRDLWAEGERGQSYVRDPSDLAPRKESADVVVVGKAYAGDTAAPEVAARVVVGEIDKTIRVTGPRRFARDGAALAPATFREAPIDWTRSAGGADSWNPVGVGDQEPVDLRGESAAPTVTPVDLGALSRGGYVAPAGFGPMAPRWAPRRDVMPEAGAAWIDADPGAPLAWKESSRPTFFQCAPVDQRLARPIRPDERILLEGLSPTHRRLVTNLPGVTVAAVATLPGGEQRPIELQADTLWIDTERRIATVSHRASLPARALEGAEVVVWLAGEQGVEAGPVRDAAAASAPAARPSGASRETVALPIAAEDSSEGDGGWAPQATVTVSVSPGDGGLAAPGGGAQLPFAERKRSVARTAPARPLEADAPARFAPAPAASFAAVGAPPLAPPAPPPARASWPGIQPSGSMPSPSAPPPFPAAPAVAAPPPVAERIDTWKLHEQAAARRAPDEAPATPAPNGERKGGTPAAVATPAPPVKRPAVEVVWFDSVVEVEAASRARTLVEQLGGDDDDELLAPRDAGAGTLEVARRDVRRWMTRAAPLELDRLQETMVDALEDDRVDRPYVVVMGELAWSFDPRETLRAWMGLGAPLAVDPRVKEALDAAERAIAESAIAMPEVLASAADRLRDAVRASARVMGSTPIETAAERWLVEERGFGRRRVWGQLRLRAHLHAKGSRAPLPVYLPDGAGLESPLAQRFAARLVGELRSRQDPTEVAPVCLRAIALGVEIVP